MFCWVFYKKVLDRWACYSQIVLILLERLRGFKLFRASSKLFYSLVFIYLNTFVSDDR